MTPAEFECTISESEREKTFHGYKPQGHCNLLDLNQCRRNISVTARVDLLAPNLLGAV
jgi:hypothetical protein